MAPKLFDDTAGFHFAFFMGDLKEKPHAHVTGSGGHAKISLETLEVLETKGFNQAEMRKILEILAERQTDSLKKWEEEYARARDKTGPASG